MPTVRQLQSAMKKLRVTKKPNNAPKIPNIMTFRIITTDPATIRKKEEITLRREMEMHNMNALKKLKKLRK